MPIKYDLDEMANILKDTNKALARRTCQSE